jgi:predicted nucleotidyltransferase
MPDPNIEQLIAVARKVRPLLDELVFVGGCATGLLITDTSAPSVRTTFDVDAIAEVSTYSAYVVLAQRLRGLGFSEDTSEGAPVCRWISSGLVLDIMPLDARVLGFSNRWYGEAVRSSNSIPLEKSLTIRLVTAPAFLATKLEAFRSRGLGDYFGSHDLEDVVSVIDGRVELLGEIHVAQPELREYLVTSVNASCVIHDSSMHYQDTCLPTRPARRGWVSSCNGSRRFAVPYRPSGKGSPIPI